MRARRFENQSELLAECSGSEEQDHDEGMREAHFGAVDGSIAGTLDDSKEVLVLRVEDDALD